VVRQGAGRRASLSGFGQFGGDGGGNPNLPRRTLDGGNLQKARLLFVAQGFAKSSDFWTSSRRSPHDLCWPSTPNPRLAGRRRRDLKPGG